MMLKQARRLKPTSVHQRPLEIDRRDPNEAFEIDEIELREAYEVDLKEACEIDDG